MAEDYKKAKEAFVTGTTGSTMFHIHSVCAVALASIALHDALVTRGIRLNLPFSWLVLVVPLLLSMTAFANSPFTLCSLLCLPTALILVLLPRREQGTPLPSTSSSPSPRVPEYPSPNLHDITPLPALTTYRAHMMLMTVLAIFAVDFPVFPRAFAKCETFGVSLMDLGVGSFVFAQGVISAMPILKIPNYLSSPLIPKLSSITRKASPIIALGLVRALLVKATDYPEHVSEYGVHWNFFLTLGLLPVLQVILHPLLVQVSISFFGVLVGIAHQILLSYGGLQEYVLNAPRTSWVSANKEGIISLTGYLSIHLLGLSIGCLILPPTPSWFRRMILRVASDIRKAKAKKTSSVSSISDSAMFYEISPLSSSRHTGKAAAELCAYALLWSFLCYVVSVAEIGLNPTGNEALGYGLGKGASRRMVNLPYILWIAAFNAAFLFAYLMIDRTFFPTPEPRKTPKVLQGKKVDEYASRSQQEPPNPQLLLTPPQLLVAINKNALAFFLLANVCTGLVNLSMRTIDASNTRALVILGVYTYGLCYVAWTVRGGRFLRF